MQLYEYTTSWFTAYDCTNCKGRLSYHQMMHSKGTCPKCGHSGGVSIVNCNSYGVKRTYYYDLTWEFPFLRKSYNEVKAP